MFLIRLNRLLLFAQRALRANRLGFTFRGTTGFALPTSAKLQNREVPLHFPDDAPLALDIIDVWLDDDYGLEDLDAIKTVVDVGGNVGVFSLWAHHRFPDAKIHVYEPNPALVPFLEKNVASIADAKVWPEGVSGKDGHARLDLLDSSRLGQATPDPTGEITLSGLANVIERIGGAVDLLKLDCEGAEWSIFEDIESFARVRRIRMEYHLTDGRTLDDLRDAAGRIGFEITKLKADVGFGIAFMDRRSTRAAGT